MEVGSRRERTNSWSLRKLSSSPEVMISRRISVSSFKSSIDLRMSTVLGIYFLFFSSRNRRKIPS